jgi:hypothetical protein
LVYPLGAIRCAPTLTVRGPGAAANVAARISAASFAIIAEEEGEGDLK